MCQLRASGRHTQDARWRFVTEGDNAAIRERAISAVMIAPER